MDLKSYWRAAKDMPRHMDFWAGVALGTGLIVGFALGRL